MNASELLDADHRILAGLIGRVWSTDSDEQVDMITKSNAESYIRMYIEETPQLHRLQQPGNGRPADDQL
jgi:hypothetical protein